MSLLGELEAPWPVPVGRGRWNPMPVLGILTTSPPCYNSVSIDGNRANCKQRLSGSWFLKTQGKENCT